MSQSASKTVSADSVTGVAARSPLASAWWCGSRFQLPIPSRTAEFIDRLWRWGGRVFGPRVVQDCWVRYGMHLDRALSYSVRKRLVDKRLHIEPMSEATLDEFTAAYPQTDQIVTAASLWAHGLRRAYAARNAAGRAVAFIWVLTSEDNQRLATLPGWSGMYPPIPPGWLQLENAFSSGAALNRGQLMTDLACSAWTKTQAGAVGILAHTGEGNRGVGRWMESMGCRPCGKIVRLRLDLPLLRRLKGFIHTVERMEQLHVAAARQTLWRWIQETRSAQTSSHS